MIYNDFQAVGRAQGSTGCAQHQLHGSAEPVGADNGHRERKHGLDTATAQSRDHGERLAVARHQGRVRGSGGTATGMGREDTRGRRAIRESASLVIHSGTRPRGRVDLSRFTGVNSLAVHFPSSPLKTKK